MVLKLPKDTISLVSFFYLVIMFYLSLDLEEFLTVVIVITFQFYGVFGV